MLYIVTSSTNYIQLYSSSPFVLQLHCSNPMLLLQGWVNPQLGKTPKGEMDDTQTVLYGPCFPSRYSHLPHIDTYFYLYIYIYIYT